MNKCITGCDHFIESWGAPDTHSINKALSLVYPCHLETELPLRNMAVWRGRGGSGGGGVRGRGSSGADASGRGNDSVISESLYYSNGLSSVQHLYWRLWFLVQSKIYNHKLSFNTLPGSNCKLFELNPVFVFPLLLEVGGGLME